MSHKSIDIYKKNQMIENFDKFKFIFKICFAHKHL